MRAFDELVERLAGRRAERLGSLSAGAREELWRAVAERPADFVDGSDDQAFLQLVQALDRHARSCADDETLDDDAFFEAYARRMSRLVHDCHGALRADAGCLDAALVAVLASGGDPASTLDALLELERHVRPPRDAPWSDVRVRAGMRLRAAISRTCLETGRYRMAASYGEALCAQAPGDPLGCRHTCALAYARLEDEASLEALDVRFGRRGSAWGLIARCLLLYKLNRPSAARRALLGYVRLVQGGAYALLRPLPVDVYLPDRPEVRPCGFEEATMAAWEADPLVADTPNLVDWAFGVDEFRVSAETFARRNDLDW